MPQIKIRSVTENRVLSQYAQGGDAPLMVNSRRGGTSRSVPLEAFEDTDGYRNNQTATRKNYASPISTRVRLSLDDATYGDWGVDLELGDVNPTVPFYVQLRSLAGDTGPTVLLPGEIFIDHDYPVTTSGFAAAVSAAFGDAIGIGEVSGYAAAVSAAFCTALIDGQVSGFAAAVSGAFGDAIGIGEVSGFTNAVSGAFGDAVAAKPVTGFAEAVSGAFGALRYASIADGTIPASSLEALSVKGTVSGLLGGSSTNKITVTLRTAAESVAQAKTAGRTLDITASADITAVASTYGFYTTFAALTAGVEYTPCFEVEEELADTSLVPGQSVEGTPFTAAKWTDNFNRASLGSLWVLSKSALATAASTGEIVGNQLAVKLASQDASYVSQNVWSNTPMKLPAVYATAFLQVNFDIEDYTSGEEISVYFQNRAGSIWARFICDGSYNYIQAGAGSYTYSLGGRVNGTDGVLRSFIIKVAQDRMRVEQPSGTKLIDTADYAGFGLANSYAVVLLKQAGSHTSLKTNLYDNIAQQ